MLLAVGIASAIPTRSMLLRVSTALIGAIIALVLLDRVRGALCLAQPAYREGGSSATNRKGSAEQEEVPAAVSARQAQQDQRDANEEEGRRDDDG